MTIDDSIKSEKIHYDLNRKTANISTLSSGYINKYEYLTGKEILPLEQGRIKREDKLNLPIL